MLRRIALASFALGIAFVVACGHQVTPEPNNSDLSGKVVVRFRTNGPINLTNYTYAIVINTCGSGPPYTPYPNVLGTTNANYSFAFLLGGQYGLTFPALEQFVLANNSSSQLNPQPVALSQSLNNLVLNSNGSPNEFTLTFTRAELDNPVGASQPCPNITPAPSSTPSVSASAGATPTATPTPTPLSSGQTPSPSPSPTIAPNGQPTTAAQEYWYFNFYSINNTSPKQVLDSLGNGGPNDITYDAPAIDTDSTHQYTIFKAVGNAEPTDPSAQMTAAKSTTISKASRSRSASTAATASRTVRKVCCVASH